MSLSNGLKLVTSVGLLSLCACSGGVADEPVATVAAPEGTMASTTQAIVAWDRLTPSQKAALRGPLQPQSFIGGVGAALGHAVQDVGRGAGDVANAAGQVAVAATAVAASAEATAVAAAAIGAAAVEPGPRPEVQSLDY